MTRMPERLKRARTAGFLLAAAVALAPAEAAPWPERSVRIVTVAAGSSSDAVARILADGLARRWNQAVVVENRPGADHILTVQGMLEARDGHTLLFVTHSAFTVNPLLHEKLPYDPKRDAAPITLAVDDVLCIAAAPSLPVSTLGELVAYAQSKPGELNYYAVAGAPYLAYLAFQKRAGIETTYVAYRNLMNALPDLAQGRIQVMVVPFTAVRGSVESAGVKLLAVTNAQRTPAAPHVPTIAEAGYPEFTFGGLLGLFGPRDMPGDVRDRVAADVRAILGEPAVTARLNNVGLIARGSTPADFAAILDEQREKWARIAREHDIRPRGRQ